MPTLGILQSDVAGLAAGHPLTKTALVICSHANDYHTRPVSRLSLARCGVFASY